jgi:UDP-N-acetylmuramyl pentapeptide phosphotransferase/UDP-N-acetylglucosamine-1-phosphate transferase
MKKEKNSKKRNLDMAVHEQRVKTIGLSDRAVKAVVRFAIILVPVVLIALIIVFSIR